MSSPTHHLTNNDVNTSNTSTIDEALKDCTDDSYDMFTLSSRSSNPFTTIVEINGTSTEMEIDTGASKSIISEES